MKVELEEEQVEMLLHNILPIYINGQRTHVNTMAQLVDQGGNVIMTRSAAEMMRENFLDSIEQATNLENTIQEAYETWSNP